MKLSCQLASERSEESHSTLQLTISPLSSASSLLQTLFSVKFLNLGLSVTLVNVSVLAILLLCAQVDPKLCGILMIEMWKPENGLAPLGFSHEAS